MWLASQQNCSQINRNKANFIVAAAVVAPAAACWLILIYGQLKLESNFLAINKTSSKEIVFVCLRREPKLSRVGRKQSVQSAWVLATN